MTAKRKRPDVYQAHANLRYEREKLSRPIGEIFSEVKNIRIELTFKDEDMQCDPNPRELNYTPTNNAFFELPCPFRECVRGGFDFSGEIHAMIHSHETGTKGYKLCGGWQDAERIGKNKCLLRANYKIHIAYVAVGGT